MVQSGDEGAQFDTVAEWGYEWLHLGDVSEEEFRGLRQRPQMTQGELWSPHCLEDVRRRNWLGVGKIETHWGSIDQGPEWPRGKPQFLPWLCKLSKSEILLGP